MVSRFSLYRPLKTGILCESPTKAESRARNPSGRLGMTSAQSCSHSISSKTLSAAYKRRNEPPPPSTHRGPQTRGGSGGRKWQSPGSNLGPSSSSSPSTLLAVLQLTATGVSPMQADCAPGALGWGGEGADRRNASAQPRTQPGHRASQPPPQLPTAPLRKPLLLLPLWPRHRSSAGHPDHLC